MKIALVHDQLQEFGGAERVLVALKEIFPKADVFTSYYNPETLGIHKDKFKDWNIITSWADRVPGLKRLHSPLRFIYPWIWESFNFDEYDVVISSCNHLSKGIVTSPSTIHISYIHHPPRYLYGYETAIEWQKHLPIKIYGHLINHHLRQWDYLASQRVDHFIANSEETKKRIEKFYKRDSEVIYPPVSLPTSPGPYSLSPNPYYITTSRLARAKHVEILIDAANKEKFQLKIIGTGRDKEYLQSLAGNNIEFLEHIPDSQFKDIYKHAKAFLFASVDEEFGIAPVEAMGYGIPVIAYASGGLKETVKEDKNGYLYHELTADSLIEKIQKLENLSEDQYKEMRKTARKEAEQYSFDNFKKNMVDFVNQASSRA